ncbi:MAG: 30S ribosomal protein S4 [Patescibacteria group bacterium]|jgi:small subunit ribosomal protein S4|nr:30S ribosomal protein S4 [Patescibacteria group bacterium]
MARDRSSIVKQSRREGYALHPKAHKALIKKSSMPGQSSNFKHPRAKSQYQIQLREKQKVKRLYGLLERQFAKMIKKATKTKGQTGENLLILLESRLDNLVYRAGFGVSRQAARQLVSHGHFLLNERRVDIPSIEVKVNDQIKLREHSQKLKYFKSLDQNSPKPPSYPSWFKVNRSKFEISILAKPKREDAEVDINEQLIVEYYSR